MLAYSAEQVLLNKQQIWGGGLCLHYYRECLQITELEHYVCALNLTPFLKESNIL